MTPRTLLPTILGLTLVTATATDYTLLNTTAPAQALVPSAANGGDVAGFVWQAESDPSNIASWQTGNTGVGYDTDTGSGGNYIPHIGINVQAGMLMTTTPAFAGNGSVFIRIPFTVNAADLPLLKGLTLRMRYDDGFVAWINGTKVTSAEEPANLAWNSTTQGGDTNTANLTGWADSDITQHLGLLHAGTNMLAIQGLNAGTGSSDLLIVPTLVATDIAPPPPLVWPSPVFTEVPGVGQRPSRPVAIRNAADGSNKLYIVEQSGIIQFLSGNTLTQFMNMGTRVVSGGEQGLLGLAFPPGFAQSRRFYVSYTGAGGALILSRFRTQTANPALGDSTTEQILLTVPHPTHTNHNGSDIHFGKDGLLYYSTGDGGSGGDPSNNAQNPNSLLGKMLRLDVEAQATGGSLIPASNPWAAAGDGVLDQIYHIGLRNPWRWSFDRLTGDMWIGDVGQDISFEEIDFVPAGTAGLNFEWRRREGFNPYNGGTTAYGPGVVTQPILEKTGDDFSVTGGFVYRGRGFPRMNGIYFYCDYGSGNFYGVRKVDGVWRNAPLRSDADSVGTFGEDESGELYMANGSRVYRITDSASDSAYLSILSNSVDPAGRVTFTWGVANGRSYVPEVSTDTVTWTPAGPPQTGTASFRLTFTESVDPPPDTGRRYFRAREL